MYLQQQQQQVVTGFPASSSSSSSSSYAIEGAFVASLTHISGLLASESECLGLAASAAAAAWDAAAAAAAGRTLFWPKYFDYLWMAEFSSSSRLERFSLPWSAAPRVKYPQLGRIML